MKQNITEKQFNELNDSQKSNWYEFCRKNKYVLYDKGGNDFQIVDFPSIGQMIEFLGDDWNKKAQCLTVTEDEAIFPNNYCGNDNICDYLWDAVKYDLEHD